MREAIFQNIDNLHMAIWSSSAAAEGPELSSLYDSVPEQYRPPTLPWGVRFGTPAADSSPQGDGFYSESATAPRRLHQARRFAGNQLRSHPYHRHQETGHNRSTHPAKSGFGWRGMTCPGPRFPPPSLPLQNEYRNILQDCGYPDQRLQPPRYFPEGDFVLPPTTAMLSDMGLPLPDCGTQSNTRDSDSDAHTDSDSEEPYSSSSSRDSVISSGEELDSELEDLLYGQAGEEGHFGACDSHSDGHFGVSDSHTDGHFGVSDCQDIWDAQDNVSSRGSDTSAARDSPEPHSEDRGRTCTSCGRALGGGQSLLSAPPAEQSLFQKLDHLVKRSDSVCVCSGKHVVEQELKRNSQNGRQKITTDLESTAENSHDPGKTNLCLPHIEHGNVADTCDQVAVPADTIKAETQYDVDKVSSTLSGQGSTTVGDVGEQVWKGWCLERQFSSDVGVVTRRMEECGL